MAREAYLIQKLGTLYTNEVGPTLVGNGFGQEGFPTPWWAP